MWTANKVLVQGSANSLSSSYAAQMKAYGTNVVAEVIVGCGGQVLDGIPVFNLVEEAVAEVGAIDTTLIFVEAYGVLDAALEAIASGIGQIMIMTRGVPPLDMVKLLAQAKDTDTIIVGPGSGGMVIPNQLWLGIDNPKFYRPGNVGIISRTHTLSNEVALELNKADLGQSVAISIGNEGILGSPFPVWLRYLNKHEATKAIVLIGYAGGIIEQATAQLADVFDKPAIAYLCGLQAPAEKPMFAQASVQTGLSYSVPSVSQPEQTIAAFKKAQVTLAKRPSEISALVHKALKSKGQELADKK